MRFRSAAVCSPEKQSLMRACVGRVPARVGPKGPPELALFTSRIRPPSMGAMLNPPPEVRHDPAAVFQRFADPLAGLPRRGVEVEGVDEALALDLGQARVAGQRGHLVHGDGVHDEGGSTELLGDGRGR